MTATLGTALLESATFHEERYGVPYCTASLVDDAALAVGSAQALAIGTLVRVGTVIASGAFGGQTSAHWVGGLGGVGPDGIGVSAWGLVLPARPYHDDAGIMLSVVLADLERDAATAVGASSIGTALEVPDVRLDVAGSWIRPATMGRDLLDALAVAAGQPAGSWWVAADGKTHLGPRPATSVTLTDLTVHPFDPALLWGFARSGSDDFAPLVPGATLTVNGLPAPLLIVTITVHVAGDDAWAELWGDATEAELFARMARHIAAAASLYLAARPYSVTSVATDGRVAVSAPPGGPFPDAPLLGHAPGIPGASFVLAPGAPVMVMCMNGSPGAPVCVFYPSGPPPMTVGLEAQTSVTVGGAQGTGSLLPLANIVDANFTIVKNAFAALTPPVIISPLPTAATKAKGV